MPGTDLVDRLAEHKTLGTPPSSVRNTIDIVMAVEPAGRITTRF